MPTRWPPEQVKYLKDNWHKLSTYEIAKNLGKNYNSVGYKARRLNLPAPHFSKHIDTMPTTKGIIWRQTRFPKFMVSEFGEVWNISKGRIQSPSITSGGPCYQIRINGKLHSATTMNLVYTTFKGPIPKGYSLYHRDGNAMNNDLSNIGVVTRSQLQTVYGRSRRVVVFENDVPVRAYHSAKEYCKKMNINYGSLTRYLNGKFKTQHTIKEDVRYSNVKVRDPRRT